MFDGVPDSVRRLIDLHLERFPQDAAFMRVFFQNAEFATSDRTFPSWARFNLNGVARGETLIRLLEREIGPLAGASVLDVGAGAGGASIAFQRHGCQVTALEIDPTRIEWLRARVAGWDLPIRVVTDPVESLAPEERFDVILCGDVIEHVEDWRSFLASLLARTRRHLYLAYPNKYSIFSILRDPHYGLAFAVFLDGRLRGLQERYIRWRGVKRSAWVTKIPRLDDVMREFRRIDDNLQVTRLLAIDKRKLLNPAQINFAPARVFLQAAHKAGLSESLMERVLLSQRKAHNLIITRPAVGAAR